MLFYPSSFSSFFRSSTPRKVFVSPFWLVKAKRPREGQEKGKAKKKATASKKAPLIRRLRDRISGVHVLNVAIALPKMPRWVISFLLAFVAAVSSVQAQGPDDPFFEADPGTDPGTDPAATAGDAAHDVPAPPANLATVCAPDTYDQPACLEACKPATACSDPNIPDNQKPGCAAHSAAYAVCNVLLDDATGGWVMPPQTVKTPVDKEQAFAERDELIGRMTEEGTLTESRKLEARAMQASMQEKLRVLKTTRSKMAGRLDPAVATREHSLYLAEQRAADEARTLAHVELKRDRIELAREFHDKQQQLFETEEAVQAGRKAFRLEKQAAFEARVADYEAKQAQAAAKLDGAAADLESHEAEQFTTPGGALAPGNPGDQPGGRSIPRDAHSEPPARRSAGDTLNPTHLEQGKQLPGGAKVSMEELNRQALTRSDFVAWKSEDELWQARRQRKQAAEERADIEEHVRRLELRIARRVLSQEEQQVAETESLRAYREKWASEASTRRERELGRKNDAIARRAAQAAEVAAKDADTAAMQAELDNYELTWQHGSTLINPDGTLTDRFEANGQFDEFAVGAGADGTPFSPFTNGAAGAGPASEGDHGGLPGDEFPAGPL